MKQRELYGVKVLVSGEEFDAYKGTLDEQLKELQERIDKAIEYMEKKKILIAVMGTDYYKLLEILKGEDK